MSKIIQIFLFFFSLKNTNLGAHFLLLIFSDNINHFITKMMPNFLTTPHYTNFQNSIISFGYVKSSHGLVEGFHNNNNTPNYQPKN